MIRQTRRRIKRVSDVEVSLRSPLNIQIVCWVTPPKSRECWLTLPTCQQQQQQQQKQSHPEILAEIPCLEKIHDKNPAFKAQRWHSILHDVDLPILPWNAWWLTALGKQSGCLFQHGQYAFYLCLIYTHRPGGSPCPKTDPHVLFSSFLHVAGCDEGENYSSISLHHQQHTRITQYSCYRRSLTPIQAHSLPSACRAESYPLCCQREPSLSHRQPPPSVHL